MFVQLLQSTMRPLSERLQLFIISVMFLQSTVHVQPISERFSLVIISVILLQSTYFVIYCFRTVVADLFFCCLLFPYCCCSVLLCGTFQKSFCYSLFPYSCCIPLCDHLQKGFCYLLFPYFCCRPQRGRRQEGGPPLHERTPLKPSLLQLFGGHDQVPGHRGAQPGQCFLITEK